MAGESAVFPNFYLALWRMNGGLRRTVRLFTKCWMGFNLFVTIEGDIFNNFLLS